MSSDHDGTSGFKSDVIPGDKLDKTAFWHDTTLPTSPTSEIPTNGIFFLTTTDGSNTPGIYENTGTLGAPVWTQRVATEAIKPNALFGDGADGDVTISSNTTLTEPKYYKNLTINATFNLDANEPMLIFVKEKLTVKGNLEMDGRGGTGGAGAPGTPGAGGASAPGTNPGAPAGPSTGTGGGGGGTGTIGSAGGAGGGGAGGAGGKGGDSPVPSSDPDIGAPGGAGGPSPASGSGGAAGTKSRVFNNILDWLGTSPRPVAIGAGGGGGGACAGGGGGGEGATLSGGAGGAGGGGAAGGAGGIGGGTMVIIAKELQIDAGAFISSNGNAGSAGGAGTGNPGVNGSAGTNPNFGGGGGGGGASGSGAGGGGGGNGGIVYLIYQTKTNNGTIEVLGGAPGGAGAANPTFGTGGTAAGPNLGVDGTDGAGTTIGNAGIIGAVGVIIEISV